MIKRKGYLKAKRGRIKRKPIKRSSKRPGALQRATGGKIWSLSKADTEFRKVMLEDRAKTNQIICAFPGCNITDPKKLTVSHYHNRAKKGTRFLIDNCDLLCRNHHYWDKQLGWEFQKQTKEKHGWDGRYTLYMRQKLGDRFGVVHTLAESGMKQKIAILAFQAEYTAILKDISSVDK